MKKTEKTPLSTYQLKLKATAIAGSLVRYLFLCAVGYVIFLQLFYVVSYSFRSVADVSDPSVVWIPKHFTLEAFGVAWQALEYPVHLWNTISVQVLSGFIEVAACALPAYGFARFKFKGKNLLFAFVLLMILIPPQMIAVSMSLNYAHFDFLGILGLIGNIFGTDIRPNLMDTGFVFWLPSIFGVGLRAGLFIFIYRQFFNGMPKELEEAAAIDGANALQTFVRVVVPSSGVAFLTVTIFSIVWHWNEYYQSILFFTDNFPLSVSLKGLFTAIGNVIGRGSVEGTITYQMACAALFIAPVLLMYIILQRKFIASIDRVGIVG